MKDILHPTALGAAADHLKAARQRIEALRDPAQLKSPAVIAYMARMLRLQLYAAGQQYSDAWAREAAEAERAAHLNVVASVLADLKDPNKVLPFYEAGLACVRQHLTAISPQGCLSGADEARLLEAGDAARQRVASSGLRTLLVYQVPVLRAG